MNIIRMIQFPCICWSPCIIIIIIIIIIEAKPLALLKISVCESNGYLKLNLNILVWDL